ncbi:MAG TPA: hypothetical protein VHS81_01830, partial [Caulobacteraceae bacterium]|nr:hypothetical protein [Caulobacteraceae bacterium]
MEIEAQIAARLPKRDWRYAEQQLYDASPLGLLGTTAALFVILLGLYAAAAAIDHRPWIVMGKTGLGIDRRAWVATCLSLIVCAALGLQRFSQLADIKDAPVFARDLPPGFSWFPTFSKTRLRLCAAIGAVVGGGGMLWFVATGAGGSGEVGLGVGTWSVAVAAVLGAMFFRGVELTRSGTSHGREVLRAGVAVDLLRIERLYPFGRAAARTASIWFAVSAATLLLLVGTSLGPAMAALGLASAAMGGWVFFGTLGRIRQAIRAAKATELEQLRHQIGELKAHLHADPAAPAKLQSLLAYEARIEA